MDGHIKARVCSTRMDSSYTAKASEVDSHIYTMDRWGRRMTMRAISNGGPKQGDKDGYALGALVLSCGTGGSLRYLVPKAKTSSLPASASPTFQPTTRRQSGLAGLARERAAAPEAPSSSSAAAPSAWCRRLVCTEPNPKNLSSLHDKYWTIEDDQEGTLIFTWGALTSPVTNQLILSFGRAHGALASVFGKQRCATKLRGSKAKAAYRELQHDDVVKLPSLQYRRVGLRLQGAESAPESFDFEAHDYEPESDDEDDDIDDDALLEATLGNILEETGL